jgi:ADP-ribose pyrophosphatase YjhB (NUDIX family)
VGIGHSDVVSHTELHVIRTAFGKQSWRARAGESREQVAAVCYRIRKRKLEFLLVRTRKGRWTFPKGGVIHGLTHAQSAGLEAFEEAGVHGRIEETSFASYALRKRGNSSEAVTHAHLCEVLRLETPQEANRAPTWFLPEQTRAGLAERRTCDDARTLARVVDRAVARIERLQANSDGRMDSLQKVRFEASETRPLIARTALVSYIGGRKRQPPALPELDDTSGKILEIESAVRDQRFSG